jgi:hypothetical protein
MEPAENRLCDSACMLSTRSLGCHFAFPIHGRPTVPSEPAPVSSVLDRALSSLLALFFLSLRVVCGMESESAWLSVLALALAAGSAAGGGLMSRL